MVLRAVVDETRPTSETFDRAASLLGIQNHRSDQPPDCRQDNGSGQETAFQRRRSV
jgi:hypothetical protein